ncbi:MAG: L-histidine N(alpha)-methyltransferase [Saprospiraceae bacterium]|nr:L-histidine N(alpha)-methyltransferase [Saprospiraceae bacterium]
MSGLPNQQVQVISELADHVAIGLASTPKYLSSKFFYDDRGSKLFQEIMQLSEYYLTRAENKILREQSHAIYQNLYFETAFNVVELGAGDGSKTRHLLGHLLDSGVEFTYCPIDISRQAIVDLSVKLDKHLPNLDVRPYVGDYFDMLEEVISSNRPTLVLFLGSNIGNFENDAAIEMLSLVCDALMEGDKLLLGVDLKKNPNIIRKAYFDERRITAAFNLNLLRRINRELGANFNEDQFDFYSHYDPITGDVRSYLISLVKQEVDIPALRRRFPFGRNEIIRTELSKKYALQEVEMLAERSGYQVIRHFKDPDAYFTDSLWVK